MKQRGPLHDEQVMRALESRAMREIVARCIRTPRSVKEISEEARLPLASTYRQVHALVEDGVLVVERSAMTPEGKPFDLYRSRIREARLLVKQDLVEVSWETNESIEDRLASMWGHLAG